MIKSKGGERGRERIASVQEKNTCTYMLVTCKSKIIQYYCMYSVLTENQLWTLELSLAEYMTTGY